MWEFLWRYGEQVERAEQGEDAGNGAEEESEVGTLNIELGAHMEGTSSADALAGKKRAEEGAFTQNRAIRSDREAGARLTAAKTIETGVAQIVSILDRQREVLPDGAAARANIVHAQQAAASKLGERSPTHQRQKDEQRQHPSYKRQQVVWRQPSSSGFADAGGSVRIEAYAATEAADHATRAGRAGMEGFIDSGIGRDKEQQPEGERESSFAAAAVLAALCTLLAMFLVGALVWVQVRECLQLKRSSKHKAHPTEEKAKRSRSRKEDICMKEARGWGQWLHWRGSTADFQEELRGDSKETVSANECGEHAATGGLWRASKEPNCGIVRRVEAYTLKQHMKAQAEGPHQRNKDERTEYGRQGLRQKKGSGKTGRELERIWQEDSGHEQQLRQVNSETLGSDDEDDEPTTSRLNSGECKGIGFQQSQDAEGRKRRDSRDQIASDRHSNGSHCSFIQQQRQLLYFGRNYDEGPAARVTVSNSPQPRKMYEHDRSHGSSTVGHTLPGAWRAEAHIREKGGFLSSSSCSAEKVPDAITFNEQEDRCLPAFGEASRRTTSTWFSGQVRPAQPSPAVLLLQQQYEKKCRDLFTRLGEVVAEGPVKPQTSESSEGNAGERGASRASAKTSRKDSSNTVVCRFDRPVLLSEEAVTEAEQLLTLLEEMFAEIKRDFRDNHPGDVTCMIRCCNSLLEKDGLMVLSRCTKVSRLMQKAQSVVEIVVPCIWSS